MTLLVTGASGKVGRELVALLRAENRDHRPLGRRTDPPLDWANASTWPAAQAGGRELFLLVPGGDDGHRNVAGLADLASTFIDAVVAAGVERVVLMSALGLQYAPPEVELRALELHLQKTVPSWAILRPNWFFQNLSDGPLADLAAAGNGVLRAPLADAAVSWVDTRDIAAVAAVALRERVNAEWSVTGPAALTLYDVQARWVAAVGRCPWTYVAVDDETFRADAVRYGWDPSYVNVLSGLFADIRSCANAGVSDDVRGVLGRPATGIEAFLQDSTDASC